METTILNGMDQLAVFGHILNINKKQERPNILKCLRTAFVYSIKQKT